MEVQLICVSESGGSGSEELKKCPPLPLQSCDSSSGERKTTIEKRSATLINFIYSYTVQITKPVQITKAATLLKRKP